MTTAAVAPRVLVRRRRFTAAEYQRLGEVGILGEDDRVELIEGEILVMSPIGPAHVDSLAVLNQILTGVLRGEALVSVQSPIRLARDGEPQPDLALLKRRRYKEALPTPADIYLVIEVADTSLAYDRNVKLPLYAAAGIPEAWLVDLNGEGIERHTEPRDGQYRRVVRAGRGETLASTVLPAVVLAVDDVLG